MKLWMMAAILLCGLGVMTSCNGKAKVDNADKAVEDTVAVMEVTGIDSDVYMPVMNQYLVDSIGAHYAKGEVCIPCATIIGTDESNPDSLLVWGDFWVFNFKQDGDTLKTVSGGDHPGLMVFQKNDKGEYVVTSFEQVEDGHGNEASAKRIFGDLYNFFHKVNSDEVSREQVRAEFIARYVKEHNLPVKYYQDYGWPAKEIPAE